MTTHFRQINNRLRRLGGVNLLSVVTLVSGLVFIQGRAFANSPQPKSESPNLFAGRKAIEAKDFQSAVKNLMKAAQENPNDADAHTLLGYSYRKLGAFDKSLEQYQRALKIDSNNRSAQEYLGELYLDMNQPAKAEKQLQALKKACPFFGNCEEYDDLKVAIERYKTNDTRSPGKL